MLEDVRREVDAALLAIHCGAYSEAAERLENVLDQLDGMGDDCLDLRDYLPDDMDDMVDLAAPPPAGWDCAEA